MRTRSLTLSLGAAVAAAVVITPMAYAAVSPAPTRGLPRTASLICDGLGQVEVAISADPSGGASAKVTDGGPVRITGSPGIKGKDAKTGAAVSIPAEGSGIDCVGGTLTDTASADADSAVTGVMTWKLAVDSPPTSATTASATTTAAATDPAKPAGTAAFPYQSQIASYLASRSGSVTVAYRANNSSTTMVYTKGEASNVTASIVKVDIMATVMRKAQEAGPALNSYEKSQLVPMIRNSDNTAATNLWNYVGKGPGVARVNTMMGLTHTTMGSGGYWGLTTTTAPDQIALIDHFSRANPVLTTTNRTYGISLMKSVSSSQDWGVTAGPPSGTVAVKNGWLPRSDGWHVNSDGFSTAAPRPYAISVLTHSTTASMDYQIATIEGVSRIIWRNQALWATVRGDWTGDGKVDLYGTSPAGNLYLFKGSGAGSVGAPTKIGAGWQGYDWIGSPGDVTKDGRTDLVARDTAGVMWLYPGAGNGGLQARRQIGSGWHGIPLIATPGDVDGNGVPDLITRHPDGYLRHYEIPATGAMRTIGKFGDAIFPDVAWFMGVRDINADGRGDFIAIDHSGVLKSYVSTGTRTSYTGVTRSGFTGFTWFAIPGDLNGSNGIDDLVARKADGSLIWYPMGANGNTLSGRSLGANAGDANRIL